MEISNLRIVFPIMHLIYRIAKNILEFTSLEMQAIGLFGQWQINEVVVLSIY